MREGKIEIYLSYLEPKFKDNILWLRPYLDREGYELLYFGAKGWTRFVPCCPKADTGITPPSPPCAPPQQEGGGNECPLTDVGPNPTGDREGHLWEMDGLGSAGTQGGSGGCGCPNDK